MGTESAERLNIKNIYITPGTESYRANQGTLPVKKLNIRKFFSSIESSNSH